MVASERQESNAPPLPPLPNGIPPWHTLAFCALALSVSIPFLPSPEEIDGLSDAPVFAHRKFPDLVSLWTLAVVRLVIASIALGLTLWLALVDPGWDVDPNYKARSRCRRTVVRLQGIGTLCPFTSWAWMILGFGYLCRGLVALAVYYGSETGSATTTTTTTVPWMSFVLSNKQFLRATFVLWELTGPLAFLVSCAVKYAIWPQALRSGKPHHLAGFRNQLQHNANAIFALLEVTLLGGLSVEFSHLSMASLLGFSYLVFTWFMSVFYFGSKTVGPQYLYWFLDTTLEETTTMAVMALFFALVLFFGVFSVVIGTLLGTSGADNALPASLPLNIAVLFIGSRFACKFK